MYIRKTSLHVYAVRSYCPCWQELLVVLNNRFLHIYLKTKLTCLLKDFYNSSSSYQPEEILIISITAAGKKRQHLKSELDESNVGSSKFSFFYSLCFDEQCFCAEPQQRLILSSRVGLQPKQNADDKTPDSYKRLLHTV